MREWDAQSPGRQEVIIWYIQSEVNKLHGMDNATNNTEIFVNPFNNNLDDLKDFGIKPDEVLYNLTIQCRRSANKYLSADKRLSANEFLSANKRLSADEFLSADELQYLNSPMLAEDPVDEADTIIECLSANELSANDVNSSNSTLPSVHKLLLPSAKSGWF
jgi:hypothetical protein